MVYDINRHFKCDVNKRFSRPQVAQVAWINRGDGVTGKLGDWVKNSNGAVQPERTRMESVIGKRL
jgi:hypothetical protein